MPASDWVLFISLLNSLKITDLVCCTIIAAFLKKNKKNGPETRAKV